MFTRPVPDWSSTSDIEFLTVPQTFWRSWRLTFLELGLGLILLSFVVLGMTQGNVRAFFCFTP